MAIDKATLGKAIQQVRKLRGMSQAKLAEDTGIQPNSLALIERGQRGVSMETLNQIAEALDVPAACLAILGSKKIAGNANSTALVKSLQKLISATIVAEVTIRAKEEADQARDAHLSDAINAIPEIENVLRRLTAKKKRTAKKAKPKKLATR